MSENHIRLYIPGPVEVSEKTFRAMCHPMIGHRSGDFASLYERIHPRLQELAGSSGPVFLSTSSAWGIMEATIRNLVSKRVLNCCGGAFSDKWYDVALRCGKQAEELKVEWGEAIDPAAVDTKLASGEFDVLTLVHNETSTGVQNPLAAIADVVKKYPDVLFVVDTVSSFSATPTPVDELGIDVLLAGCQKALAMPPGLTIFTASDAALDRAATLDDRGYYFDFLEFKKNQEKFMTPSTPCISLIYALESKLEDIFEEGLDARYQRHLTTNAMVHSWIAGKGFEHFAPEGYRSVTLTCAANTLEIDLGKWNKLLKSDHHLMINGGYGKIKDKTLRISNMGDETEKTIAKMLGALDDTLPRV